MIVIQLYRRRALERRRALGSEFCCRHRLQRGDDVILAAAKRAPSVTRDAPEHERSTRRAAASPRRASRVPRPIRSFSPYLQQVDLQSRRTLDFATLFDNEQMGGIAIPRIRDRGALQ
jgi:hypothetical protein